jgi:hypothetical protein
MVAPLVFTTLKMVVLVVVEPTIIALELELLGKVLMVLAASALLEVLEVEEVLVRLVKQTLREALAFHTLALHTQEEETAVLLEMASGLLGRQILVMALRANL